MKVVKRPWGDFKEFVKNTNCTVKILTVKKGESISLQYHHKRSEMWHILSGGIVEIGKKKQTVKKGDTVRIKKGQLHRATAGKKEDLVLLEISTGEFSESDIVRVEDKYGRIKAKDGRVKSAKK